MADFRRYTGTQRLQALWGILVMIAFLGSLTRDPLGVEQPLTGAAIGAAGILGLMVLGLRERFHWNRMVAASAFEHDRGTRAADLEKLYQDRSVLVSTTLPGIFAQTHTELLTRVEDVDAEFTIRIEYVGKGGTDTGIQTGNDDIDEAFVIEGREENVEQIVVASVASHLAAIDTPGVCTITGEEVRYAVPFTRLSASELKRLSDAIVAMAARVEAVAGD